jgi:hypothetical protein
MNDNPDQPVRRAPGQGWRVRRASLAVAGLMTVAALVAACGGGLASSRAAQGASGSPAASGSSPGSTYQRDLAYASCIRSHGVPNFPDPKPNGGFDMTSNPNDPQLQAAQRACANLLPAGQQQTTGHFTPQQVAQLLTYAKCMRSHGILNFPDPTSKGLGALNGIDINSPQFQSASRACQHLLPAIGGNGNGPVSAPGGGS